MTAPTLDRPAAPSAPPPDRPTPAPTAPQPRGWVVQLGWVLSLTSALLLGFAVYLLAFSGIQQQHFQSTSYKTFREQLGNAVAPTGAGDDGRPVAIIDIPAIGLSQAVVVEGTSGRDLMRGPGHRRDTALPGQTGASVIFGRGTTFGAPFGQLSRLRVGDKIYATTGQGKFTYTVNAYGDSENPIKDMAARARMVLVTGDSDWMPHGTVLIGARLDGDPEINPRGRPAALPTDKVLAADRGALPALQLWSLALLLAVVLAVLGARYWQRRAAYLSMAPVVAALLWSVYENAAALLPNVY